MKKILLLLVVSLFLANAGNLRAQCYGTVVYDDDAAAGGLSTFTINTTYCNELIMISYDGWPSPGSGPVNVDGIPATHIVTGFDNINSGIAETYAYIAPLAGTHTIACTETGYSYPPYGLNFAAAFYVTGSSTPLSIASLTSTVATITCTTGGSISSSINTTIPNSMIYGNWENNNGQGGPFTDTWTGATFLGQLHEGNGIDASHAYEPAPTIGTYNFTVANNANPNNGCGGLVLTLVCIPPPLCTNGGGLTALPTVSNPTCGSCNGSISIAVSGGLTPYTYTWTPNISSTNSASNLCGGTYSCTIQDNSCPPKDTTLVFVLPSNSLGLVDTLITNENCYGDCNGSSTIVPHGGVPPYIFSWSPVGGNNPQATGLCAGNYTVTVNDNGGCSNTILAVITQPAQLNVTTTVNNNVSCYQGANGKATATPTGGTAPYTYNWSTTPAQTTAIATALSAGTYTVTITDARGCNVNTTATVTQPSQLDVSLSGPAIICNGTTGTLTAGSSGGTSPYNYGWKGSPYVTNSNSSTSTITAGTQTDTVTVTDANGCTVSAQITVNLGPTITATILGPVSICKGLTTTLCADVQGGTGGNMYVWSPGGEVTPCITVSPSSTTTYSLQVTDNCGSVTNAVYTLLINPLPNVSFTSSLTQGCAPLCVQFYNTTTLSQGKAASYLWTFGNGDSSKIQSPVYCYPNSGTYNLGLTVTSDSGCSNTLSRTSLIKAFAKPNGAFTYSPQPVNILEPTVQFTNQTSDNYSVIYWSWSFGDNSDSMSNALNPSHTYADTGHYCVDMVSMDINGCTDTVTNCLVIEPAFTLYIPSAFTPNGDSKNPTFEPKGDYIKSFEMYIFDRWGMQLYHTTDITKGWDGSVSGGGFAQEDTYVYRIIVTDSEKKQHTYVGNVTLLK